MTQERRTIYENQGPYVGERGERFESVTRYNSGGWVEDCGADLLDRTQYRNAVLTIFAPERNGKVTVYSSGNIEKDGVTRDELIDIAQKKLFELENVRIQIGESLTRAIINEIKVQEDLINKFLSFNAIYIELKKEKQLQNL